MFYKQHTVVTPGGERVSLSRWATDHGIPYNTVLDRWKKGVRDPMELVYGGTMIYPRRIRAEDIEWLKETRFARIGMIDEWKIACDLIGVPRSRAKELKLLVEEDGT